jgi:hypothetical protein
MSPLPDRRKIEECIYNLIIRVPILNTGFFTKKISEVFYLTFFATKARLKIRAVIELRRKSSDTSSDLKVAASPVASGTVPVYSSVNKIRYGHKF